MNFITLIVSHKMTVKTSLNGHRHWISRIWNLSSPSGGYGTKQAMREANRTLREALVEIGVHQLVMDEHVYFLRRGDSVLILCVFVDDILAVATSSTVIEWFRGNLSKKFEITHEMNPTVYLSLEIERDIEKRYLKLHQTGSSLSMGVSLK